MAIFKLPVFWMMGGEIEIEAKNKEEFFKLVKKFRNSPDELNIPIGGDYLDDSFEICDDELIMAINKLDWFTLE